MARVIRQLQQVPISDSCAIVFVHDDKHCRPCQAVAPKFVELSRNPHMKASFYALDCNQLPARGPVPRWLILSGGQLVETLIGADKFPQVQRRAESGY